MNGFALSRRSLILANGASGAPGQGMIETSNGMPNELIWKNIKFIGECPGEKLDPLTGWFKYSGYLDPSHNWSESRVRLTRIEPTIQGAVPYTDRKYSAHKNTSESFDMLPGGKHRNRYFVLGNSFASRIHFHLAPNSGPAIEGIFDVKQKLHDYRIPREGSWKSSYLCGGSKKNLERYNCADVRELREKFCPNGRLISSFITPNSPWTRGLFTNETMHRVVAYLWITGNPVPTSILLYPGQRYEFFTEPGARIDVGASFHVPVDGNVASPPATYGYGSIPTGGIYRIMSRFTIGGNIAYVDEPR